MDFKPSFIPKQPLENQAVRQRPRTIGFFTLLVAILFFVTIAISVGFVIYRSFLKNSIISMQNDLKKSRASFDETRIEELRRLDLRIKMAKERLDAHTAPTLLFSLLETNTLSNVAYKTFLYEVLEDLTAHIKIAGKARNFSAVALQSDVFGGNKNIVNPIFENLNPDTNGLIDFTVNTTIDRAFLSYGNRIGFGDVPTPAPTGGTLNDDKNFSPVLEKTTASTTEKNASMTPR